MRYVEDHDGRRYALLKRSGSSSLVLDLETGERRYRDNRELSTPDDEHADDPQAEVLGVLADEGAVPVRTLLERTTVCESDLFAITRELALGGVIREVERDGEPAWALADESRRPDQS